METIKLKDGRTVSKQDYIRAKTNDLIEYGYNSLTESDVSEQLDFALAGQKLDIIGIFIQSDLELNP